jgi:hypothetical protein
METEKPNIANLVESDEPNPSQAAAIVEPREAWEQKCDESQRAYTAFSIFRDSERRSLKAVATSLTPPCSIQNIFWWSQRHNWRQRTDAFDLHQDREQRQAFARNRVRMRDRHLAVAQGMLNVAANGLAEWQKRIAQKLPINLAPEQISMLVKAATELEKSTLGVATENQRSEINIWIGAHKYADEKAGDSGVEGEAEEWESLADFEARQYAALDAQGKAAWESWRNPPQPQGKPAPKMLECRDAGEAEYDSDDKLN